MRGFEPEPLNEATAFFEALADAVASRVLARLEPRLAQLSQQTRGPAQPAPDDAPLCLDAAEAAARIGCSQRHVWTLARRGELPCIHVGRLRRFTRQDVEEFLSRHRAGAPSEVAEPANGTMAGAPRKPR